MTSPDENALVDAARQGCPDAFALLMHRYERMIFAFIYRTMKNHDDAIDLTQDTFARAHQHIGRCTGDLNFSAWLHRIANNACLDLLRRRQKIHWRPWEEHKHDHLKHVEGEELPEVALIRSETDAMVQTVLDAMPAHHRLALVLREFDGLGCDEIGRIMGGKSRTAMKSLLFRARYDFRAIWRRLYGDERERIAA